MRTAPDAFGYLDFYKCYFYRYAYRIIHLKKEDIFIAIFHCHIKIVGRGGGGGGRCVISAAAYRSGEKLEDELTGIIYDYTAKGGVVMNEIMLPINAPMEFQNREVLWNAVEKFERGSNAQLAREIEIALPREMTREEHIECTRGYIQSNFVDKGMIADWALHDKGDGNPHVHILLTLRAFNENGKWKNKRKEVFANDRDVWGKPIFNPSLPHYDPKDKENTSQYRFPKLDENGKQKVRIRKGKGEEKLWEKVQIPLYDWDDHANAELWRKEWSDACNRYLAEDKKIDHRSNERRGIKLEATIHEGFVSRNMEKQGKTAERCEINREIGQRNRLRQRIWQLAREITDYIIRQVNKLYGNYRSVKHDFKSFGEAGRDARSIGGTTDRKRILAESKRAIEQSKRLIEKSEYESGNRQRVIDKSEQRTDRSKRILDQAERRIHELKAIKDEQEQSIIERLNSLKQRRNDARQTVLRIDDRAVKNGTVYSGDKSEPGRPDLGRELRSQKPESGTSGKQQESKEPIQPKGSKLRKPTEKAAGPRR